jgi:hypothetical protein
MVECPAGAMDPRLIPIGDHYVNLVERLGVRWTPELCARDLFQNFHDAGKTLDQARVDIALEPTSGLEGPAFKVRVSASQYFDCRDLIGIGAGTKAEDTSTAGHAAEGTKIAGFVLLRDHNVQKIEFGSGYWRLNQHLAPVPPAYSSIPAVGLWARVERAPLFKGNYLEITTTSREVAEQLVRAHELFLHAGNPDFQEPTQVIQAPGGGLFGFKVLGQEGRELRKGHLYDAGQRRHYLDKTKGWARVEGLHLWTFGMRAFELDRERRPVPQADLEGQLIEPLVKAIPKGQLESVLRSLEPLWSFEGFGTEAAVCLLRNLIERMRREKITVKFEEKYLFRDGYLGMENEAALKAKGYVLCDSYLEYVGMRSSKAVLNEVMGMHRIEPNAEQKRRCGLLATAIASLQDPEFPPLPIWLYKGFRSFPPEGLDTDQHVWLEGEALGKSSFSEAVVEYGIGVRQRRQKDEGDLVSTGKLVGKLLANAEDMLRLQAAWDGRQEITHRLPAAVITPRA